MSIRQQQRLATEQAIIASAQEQFMAHGFSATTIRMIASAASVSTGSVMSVGDKNALLIRVFETRIGEIHRHRAQDFPITQPTAALAVVDTVRPFLSMFDQHQDLGREYFSILVRGGHQTTIFDELASDLKSEFQKIITHFGTHDDAQDAAQALYLGFLGVLVIWSGRHTDDPYEQFRRHVDFFFAGTPSTSTPST